MRSRIIYRPDGERLRIVAAWGASPELIASISETHPHLVGALF